MKAVSVRSFNANVKTLTEPVEIVTFDRSSKSVITLGFYYPKGTEPKPIDASDLVPVYHPAAGPAINIKATGVTQT